MLPDVGNPVCRLKRCIFAKAPLHDGGISVRHKSGILTWKIVGQDRSMFYAENKRAQGNRKLNNYRKCFGVRDLEFEIGVMTKIT